MTDHATFTTDIDLRFRDIDAMGHVNNAVYFTFFEYGRWRFLYSDAQKDKFAGLTFILAHVSCDYRHPVRLEDLLTLHMWVHKIGHSSFGFRYRLVDRTDPTRVFAPGESVQVFFDYQENRSEPIPDAIRAALMTYLEWRGAAMRLSKKQFERSVERAIGRIPAEIQDRMQNLIIAIEDNPSPELLEDMGIPAEDTLFGLYTGIPLPERSLTEPPLYPDEIVIFREPLLQFCRDVEELENEIEITVVHEVAHYLGIDDDRLEELGYG